MYQPQSRSYPNVLQRVSDQCMWHIYTVGDYLAKMANSLTSEPFIYSGVGLTPFLGKRAFLINILQMLVSTI